jgi:hypothetical protein
MQFLQPQLPPLQAPVVVSNSEVESAARCDFQHQLGYRERWTKGPFNPQSAAGQGIAWHEVLEEHYRTVQDFQQAAEARGLPWWSFDQEKCLREAHRRIQPLIAKFVEMSLELGELISWMYAGHVGHWGVDPDWRIIDVERAGEVPLSPPASSEVPSLFRGTQTSAHLDFRFKYRADLIIEERGKLWLVDHKSVGNFPNQLDLDFDPQIDRYTWALRQEGVPIFGQLFSQARRKMLKRAQTLEERHRRPRTYRTDAELDSIANDLFQVIYTRYAQQLRVESRSIHPEGAPRDAPRQPSARHCSFLCDFTEACLAGRKGSDSRDYLVELGMTQNFTRH